MTSSTIQFFTENIDFNLDHPDKITSWLSDVCEAEKKEIESLNYIFCSDEYLLQINIEYLNHDYYTDVISFPYSTEKIEGDIFMSIDRVKENATKLNVPFERELQRIMIHGLLHFLGYLDKTPEDKKTMTNKENFYLAQLS